MSSARLPIMAAAALVCAAALVQPARAAEASCRAADAESAVAATPPAHHGLAFAARKGAQARIVEPDGRVVMTDSASDLVAPASITARQARSAIAQLIRTLPDKRAPAATETTRLLAP